MNIINRIINLKTAITLEFIDITDRIEDLIKSVNIKNGIINIQSLHTTMAIIVNEAEPLLIEDIYNQVKKELAFYEKVMAPEKQADGLVIDDLSVSTTASSNHFRFQVTLVQQKIKKRYAKGRIELSFSGSLNNKPHKLNSRFEHYGLL